MNRAKKKTVISKFAAHVKDTGSIKVQIALISQRINDLTQHLDKHKKDNHSRRGLLMLVGKRRKLLAHYKNVDAEGYETFTQEVGLRK